MPHPLRPATNTTGPLVARDSPATNTPGPPVASQTVAAPPALSWLELWIQERISNQELTLEKVLGELNAADLFTKHLLEAKIEQFCNALICVRMQGRSGIGLHMQRGEMLGEATAV